MASRSSGSESTAELEAHEIRITSQGKMQTWIEFALEFFEKNAERPLVLHTLPNTRATANEPGPNAAAVAPANPTDVVAQEQGNNETEAHKKNKERMPSSMATIPRLISVAEIIKREYLKKLDPVLAEGGHLSGLHQYNELGSLEDTGADGHLQDHEQERLDALALALQGKNHLKQRKVAYMKITLCRKQIPSLKNDRVTYQQPALRKLSKSARARAKRRLKKEAELEEVGSS